jgi:hypothetical protein
MMKKKQLQTSEKKVEFSILISEFSIFLKMNF